MIPAALEEENSVKHSKFSDAQIALALRQAEKGTSIEDVCRETGISQATCYAWKKTYRGPIPSETNRLRQLEEENARLKRLVANLSRDKEMLQNLIKRKL